MTTDIQETNGFEATGANERDKQAQGGAAVGKTPHSNEGVPEWLGSRLRQMFTDVMHEPVPDEFAALLKKLEDKERG